MSKDFAASIRGRLLNIAKNQGVDRTCPTADSRIMTVNSYPSDVGVFCQRMP